jgi:hypothetical protein
MVVSPPQLGFWCRLLKEDLGRIIWINIPIHKSTDVTTEQMKPRKTVNFITRFGTHA